VGAPATAAAEEVGGGLLPPPASPCRAEGNTCCRDEEEANGTPGCNGSGDGDCPVIVAYGLGVGASLLKLTSNAPVSESMLALLVARANNAGEGVAAPPAVPPPAPVEGSENEEDDRSVLMGCKPASKSQRQEEEQRQVSGGDTKGTVVPTPRGTRGNGSLAQPPSAPSILVRRCAPRASRGRSNGRLGFSLPTLLVLSGLADRGTPPRPSVQRRQRSATHIGHRRGPLSCHTSDRCVAIAASR
jgi:hypothetical protein